MWSAQVNRREFFEIYLGSTKLIESRVHTTSQINTDNESEITLIWDVNPRERFALPSLVIVTNGDVKAILSSVKAAPQTPSPITALSRFISRDEAKQHFDLDVLPLNERVFPAIAALILIEGVLHGDGRLGIKQLTPLICKRTLGYAWGRSLVSRVSAESFLELPERWLDVYSILNMPPALTIAQRTIASVVGGLGVLTQLAIGIRPNDQPGALAFELLNGDKDGQERAWQSLTARFSRSVSIEAIHSMAREERGLQLQEALRALTSIDSRVEHTEMIAACAFLATRVAPGSLEHLEVLQRAARPELLVWYALYAALQHPREILSSHNGLGLRLIRDLLRNEEKTAPPIADISYLEFKIVARAGLEAMAGRIGHASEIQIELIPYVSTSFTFQHRNLSRGYGEQQSLGMEPSERPASPRARAVRLASELAQLAKDLPDGPDEYVPTKRSRRRSS